MRGVVVADHHLDIGKAVKSFLQNYESLVRLPLISDFEMLRLFGDEVASALAELEDFNREGVLCLNCGGSCCRLVSCEIYTPELACCPVQSLRPVLCRLHFCKNYSRTYPLLVKESGDIYLDSLIAAEKSGCKIVSFFDTPPLKKAAPEVVREVSQSLLEFKAGRRDRAGVLQTIESNLDKYRPGTLHPLPFYSFEVKS